MDALAGHINVFVRLFSSINRLFCHVRWLERNLRNTSMSTLIIVGGIIIFCIYLVGMENGGSSLYSSLGLPEGSEDTIRTIGPFLIVGILVGLFLARRFYAGPQGGSGFESVMFGGDRHDTYDPRQHVVEGQNVQIYRGVPSAPPHNKMDNV
mmetsp:Transcript_3945/g.6175  ORF Transcript_3945/g.6175 Transcript_3945/m.6175 type:complete len:152 (+) Transcript_3945:64-519(+)